MRTATIREAQPNLPSILRAVSRGEVVEITRRNRVVARLVPAAPRPVGGLPDFVARARAMSEGRGMERPRVYAHRERGRARGPRPHRAGHRAGPGGSHSQGPTPRRVQPARGIGLATRTHLELDGPEAAGTLEDGGELARECGDIEGLAAVHVTHANLAYLAGDANRTRVHVRQAMEIAEKIGSPLVRLLALWGVGRAHLLSGNWHDAVAAIEQALAGAREERTGLNNEPRMLTDLADARLGLGETAAARAAAEEALDVARRRGMRTSEIAAHIVLGRVLIQAGARGEEVEAALDAALGLVGQTGARVHLPFIHLARAALARSLGDGASRERELREAHRLFTEMGAPIRAEQVLRQLERR